MASGNPYSSLQFVDTVEIKCACFWYLSNFQFIMLKSFDASATRYKFKEQFFDEVSVIAAL